MALFFFIFSLCYQKKFLSLRSIVRESVGSDFHWRCFMEERVVKIARKMIGLGKRKKKAQDGGSSAFIGNGKLTKYKNKEDSWILDQMSNGVKKGIPLSKGEDGQWSLDGYKKREKIIALSILKGVVE